MTNLDAKNRDYSGEKGYFCLKYLLITLDWNKEKDYYFFINQMESKYNPKWIWYGEYLINMLESNHQ